MNFFENQRVEEQDVHFKVYNRGKPVMIVRYVKATQKADAEFIDKNAIPCMPEENIEWKDISRFLCSRINWREPIVPLEEIKQRKGRMATDYMYIKFYVR